MRPGRRGVRWAGRVARALAVLFTFLAALPIAVLLHLGVPAEQRAVARTVDALLSNTLKGKIQLLSVGSVGVGGARGVTFEIQDTMGKRVLFAQGVNARVGVLALARNVLFGNGGLAILIDRIDIGHAEVILDDEDGDGTPTLVDALAPAPSGTSTSTAAPSRRISIRFPWIVLHHAWVHGAVSSRPIDVEVSAEGHVTVPATPEEPIDASVSVQGRAWQLPFHADGAWQKKRLEVHVRLPEATREAWRASLPEFPLDASLGLEADVGGPLEVLEGHARLAAAGRAPIAVDTQASLGPDMHLVAHVRGTELDAHAWLATAPSTKISPDLEVRAVLPKGGAVEGDFSLRLPPGTVNHTTTPGVRATGRFQDATLHARVDVDEPGIPTTLTFDWHTAGSQSLDFRVHSMADFTKVKRWKGAGSGQGRLDAAGRYDFDRAALRAGARLEGLGQPIDVNLEGVAAQWHVAVAAPAVELASLARWVPASPARAGRLRLRAEGDLGGARTHGHVRLDLAQVEVGPLHDLALAGEGSVDGRTARAGLQASARGLGSLHIAAPRVDLGNDALAGILWKRITGEATLSASLNLAELVARFPDRGVGSAGGWVRADARVSRSHPDAAPAIELGLETGNLAARSPPTDERATRETKSRAPWELKDVDLRLKASFGGPSDAASVDAEVLGKTGTLAQVNAKTTLSLQSLLDDPVAALRALRGRWFDVHARVPIQRLDQLPAFLGTAAFRGEVGAEVAASGTIDEPNIDFVGTARGVRAAFLRVSRPMDLDARVRYDALHARLDVSADQRGVRVLEADADADIPFRDVLQGVRRGRWRAGGRARLHDFPLKTIAALRERHIDGAADGQFEVRDLFVAPTVHGALELRDLALGAATFSKAVARIDTEGEHLDAHVRLDQADGYGEASAKTSIHWKDGFLPSFDGHALREVAVGAQNFRAAAVCPFAGEALSELDGRIDGNGRIADDGTGAQFSGAFRLQKGVVQAAVIGQEFHNVQGLFVLEEHGAFRLESFSADGLSGRVTASGRGQFQGLLPVEGDLEAHIARGQALPITFEGASFGQAWGAIDVHGAYDSREERFDLRVGVPELHFDLPETSLHTVQELDEDDSIHRGARTEGGRFVRLPIPTSTKHESDDTASPLRLKIAVHLGNDVWITRGTDLRARLTGDPQFDLADEMAISGQIRIAEGLFEVMGKRFVLDNGTVTLDPDDPSNPTIVASAHWDATDGSRVFAEYTGPVETGNLRLRSEPPYSQNEILSLLVVGSPDGSFGATPSPSSESSSAVRAAGLGGGLATRGLNKALSNLSTLDVTTRVNTTNAQSPRPEVALALARNLSAQVGYDLGLAGPGQSPDRTWLTLDWRMRRRLDLSTTLGDKGSSILDLLWQYRY